MKLWDFIIYALTEKKNSHKKTGLLCNRDITIYRGSSKIISLYRGIVISKIPI